MIETWLNRAGHFACGKYSTRTVLLTLVCQDVSPVGGLWNDCSACQLEYHDTLLLAFQQHRMVAYLKSKHDSRKLSQHILSIHIFLCPTSFRPLPFGLKFVRAAISMHYSSAVCVNVAKQKHGSFWTNSESVSCRRCPCHNVSSRFGSHFFNQSAFEMH